MRILSVEEGIVTRADYDHASETLIIKQSADIEANIDANKREFNENMHSRYGEMKKVASIPTVVIDKWCADDGINYLAPEHKGALVRKLNDPDNRFFRTMPGKL